jgi:hypothetical protein
VKNVTQQTPPQPFLGLSLPIKKALKQDLWVHPPPFSPLKIQPMLTYCKRDKRKTWSVKKNCSLKYTLLTVTEKGENPQKMPMNSSRWRRKQCM